MNPDDPLTEGVPVGGRLSIEKMPAHWLMARLGKRVLRPGGLEMTRWLLDQARVTRDDDIVEFAPGLGVTAREILSRAPRSYVGVERDQGAAAFARKSIAEAGFPDARIVEGDASAVPVPAESASLVVGEAMLSMQTVEKKAMIMAEARRLLRPAGRYLIHELGVVPDDIDRKRLDAIQADLSSTIHVGVRIGTVDEWKAWLAAAGFTVDAATVAPMRLLEMDRMIRDEGAMRTVRFVFNALRTPGAAARLRAVRAAFRRHRDYLRGVAFVARRPDAGGM